MNKKFKWIISGFVFVFLFILVLTLGVISAHTQVTGTVYNSSYTDVVGGVLVNITCDPYTVSATTLADGTVSVIFNTDACASVNLVSDVPDYKLFLSSNEPCSDLVCLPDAVKPLVTIISPNLSQVFTTTTASFEVSTDEVSTCYYSIDNGTSTAMTANSVNDHFTATQVLADGSTYSVNFNCTDTSGNINDTESVSFSIAVPVVVITDTNNGGGGHGRTTNYCGNGVCDSHEDSDSCLKDCPVEEPLEELVAPIVETKSNESTTGNDQPAGITGFAIGDFLRSGLGIGILAFVLLVILIALWLIVKRNMKKGKKVPKAE